MAIAKIKISFWDHSDLELENKAQAIALAMTDNEYFKNPTPDVPELLDAISTFSDTLAAAENGGRQQIIEKNAARKELVRVLRELGNWITMIAKGDEKILASCGYDLYGKRSAAVAITAPQIVKVISRSHPGEVEIVISGVKGKLTYSYEYTLDPLAENSVWHDEPETLRRHIIRGLQSGKKYWFRVAAIGPRGVKEYSILVSCIVQ